MRLRILFFFISVCVINKLTAQVNLQNGSANFSLPMFDWKENKSRLYSAVALNYSSGNGLKVNDVASNVGQGWNLIAGGVITRMQVGEPDDQIKNRDDAPWINNIRGEQYLDKIAPGYLFASDSAIKGCPDALRKYPIYHAKNLEYVQHNKVGQDRQLDYFFFQFNGKSGMFILDPVLGKVNDEYTGVLLGDSKVKIKAKISDLTNQGIRTRIDYFTIQDIDGLIYKFQQKSLTKVLKLEFCDEWLRYLQKQPKFEDKRVYHQTGFEEPRFAFPWIVSGWYLTEIRDPLTNRVISFNYGRDTVATNLAGQDISFNDGDKKYITVIHKKSITKQADLTEIDFPDTTKVIFNYSSQQRFDLAGSYALNSIDFKYRNRSISRYVLRTTYVFKNRYGTPTQDFEKPLARLYLRSIQKYGVDLKEESQPYSFDYYTGGNADDDFVPPPNFYAHDIWGFYNGNNSKSYSGESINLALGIREVVKNKYLGDNLFGRPQYSDDGFKRAKGLCYLSNSVSGFVLNPKANFAKNGLLKQIIYPTGGTLSYEYEQNFGLLNGISQYTGGVHVSKTKSTDGGYSNGCDNPITTSYNYLMADGSSSLWGLEMPVHEMQLTNHYAAEERRLKPEKLKCEYDYLFPGILSQQQKISLSNLQVILQIAEPVMTAITVITTVMDIMNFSASPVSVVIDIIGLIAGIVVSCFIDVKEDMYTTVYYNYDLNAAGPLPTQYKRVEVIEGTGGIGKTVHDFTSNDDYPLWVPENQNPLFTAKQRFASWAYGLPKKSTVFDANNKLVKETINEYNWAPVQTIIEFCGGKAGPCNDINIPSSLVACNCLVKESISQNNKDWADPAVYSANYKKATDSKMAVDFYGYYSGRVELIRTREKLYNKDNSGYVQTLKEYEYNWNNYEVRSEKITESNGDILRKSFVYSIDKTGGIFNTLNNNNIVSLLVETSNEIYRSGGFSWLTLNQNTTDYTQLLMGDIKPSNIWERRFDQPADLNSGSLKLVQAFSYDLNGNLTGIKDEGSRSITNHYGYKDKYIIASVINAETITDKSAYTSFEDDQLGNWNVSGSTNTITLSVTGTTAFNLTGGNSLQCSGLNSSKGYKLSFWATSAGAIVSAGTKVVSAPTINGFTYYEYDIPAGIGSVTVSGNTTIDELRLYPQNSRMRTVAYDPLLGKTAEADENNRITYYEYDNLGRLQFVKDENRNIVKMYEYNSVSNLAGCPSTYYNLAISELFTKNNCTGNSIGSTVTITIAANTYSSTISQEDADIKAENYLLANGQDIANSNGFCIPVFYNTVQSGVFTTICEEGYKGGTITYTVAAGAYSSTVSQFEADSLARVEVDANGDAWANDPRYAVCTIDTAADWTAVEPQVTYCQLVNNSMHLFILSVDINPNSGTYSQTRYIDIGTSTECSIFSNTERSQVFVKQCIDGGNGTAVTYTVAAGKYTSTISQADADQKAINDININGQAYANIYGQCIWYSDYIGENFSKDNCSQGWEPIPCFVEVPANSYYSYSSKQDANDQARAYAQQWANNNCSCRVSGLYFTVYNSSQYSGWNVQLTNVSTNATYSFMPAYGVSYLGAIPEGVYDITVYNIYSNPNNTPFEAGCGYYITGPSAFFYNIPLTQQCNSLSIGYDQPRWGNYVLDSIYYKQDCPSGTGPAAYPVHVDANTFYSNISQDDADRQAREYGQQQANLYGNCRYNFSVGVDLLCELWYISFTNTATGTVYNFTLSEQFNKMYLPVGNYNIHVYSRSNNTYAGFSYCSNSLSSSGYELFLYNIAIDSYCWSMNIYGYQCQ